ncbi:MAG TPA: hypothetical protein VNG51_11535 [Ktedonobacteraceae bacterium]|nr:hypothetical protein [Ktedonobacteraceae bacterium]
MQAITIPTDLERRKEDYPLITGQAHFVDDVRLPARWPAVLHMAVVRSPYAHAAITHVSLDQAMSLPGVAAAFSGADLVNDLRLLANAVPVPGLKQPVRRPLAVSKVHYVGDAVAVVLAESPVVAEDALDLVEVDYVPLPAVVDPEAALAQDAPLLYEDFGSNVAFESHSGGGDIAAVFAQADYTLKLRLVNQRLAPSSLEPRACLFDLDPHTGQLIRKEAN